MGLLNKFVRKPEIDEVETEVETEVEVEETDFTSMKFETQEIVPEAGIGSGDVRSDEVREIDELRADVTRMLTALRDSMRLSQNTVGDIDKISRFLETAEANTHALERLRPENAKLKSKLESVRSEISKADVRVHEVESRVSAYKSRYEQSHDELEATRARLIEVEENFRREKAKRGETTSNVQNLLTKISELQSNIASLESERDGLSERVEDSNNSKAMLNRRITELLKRSEHLSAQMDDERRTKEMAVSKLRALKLDYTQLKAGHVEYRARAEHADQEVKASYKILTEFQKRSEDKIFALTSALESQKTERKISEDMVRYEDSEKAKLKTETNRAKRQVRALEKLLKQKTQDLDDNRAALEKSKITNEELNDKFLAMLVEMDSLRRAHQNQARKLGEYSLVEGVASGQDFQSEKGQSKTGKRPADQLSGQTIRGDGMIANLKLVTGKK